MKQALAIILHSSFFILLSAPAAEVVVYSPPSTSPLHVAVMSTNDMTISGARSFPASYTGHRAVCDMPSASTNDTFCAWIGGDSFAPGDPFGVSSLREYPAVGLARTSAVTPRLDLWSGAVDRSHPSLVADTTNYPNLARFDISPATEQSFRVRVLRYQVDDYEPFNVGSVDVRVMLDRVFRQDARAFIHEGDFLRDGQFDLDWEFLKGDTLDNIGFIRGGGVVTNVNYLVLFGNGQVDFDTLTDKNGGPFTVHPLMISRRFEKTRTAPTAVGPQGSVRTSRPGFAWKIVGEDPWASEFGTTYTAFKLKLWSGSETNAAPVVSTDFIRMPSAGPGGVRSHWLDRTLQPNATYTWQVFAYNSKFKTDKSGSAPMTFTTDFTE